MITVTKIEGIEHVTGRLSHLPHIVERATVSGLNKIGSQAMTQVRRSITKRYNIKQKDLKGYVTLTRARRGTKNREGSLVAVIHGKGGPIPLMLFDAKPKEVPSQKGIPVKRRKPVTVKVLKAGGRKPVSHGFLARMKSGKVSVFKREGRERFPIKELYAPGITKMFETEGIAAAKQIVETKGKQILQHELDFYLKREGMK